MDRPRDKRLLVGDITEADFIRTYWRRQPLFVKNGALDILDLAISEQTFDNLAEGLKKTGAGTVRTRGSDVTFVENLSAHMPELRRSATHYAALFGVPTAWFDGVKVHSRGGIGRHFDHSDNFVLQQTGVKVWTLSPPSVLSTSDKARRMLGVAGVGTASEDAANSLSFELEPGDFLYLPLFWVHSGISEGPSFSLSLVCPAVSFRDLLLASLRQVMNEHLMGHQPVPSLHAPFTNAERDAHSETLQKVTGALLRKLTPEDMIKLIVAHQLSYLNRTRAP